MCNEQGITIEMLLQNGFEVHITPKIIKDLWRNIQTNLYGDISTTQLTTEKILKIYDVFNKKINEMTGDYIPFPSVEEIIYKND